MKFSWKIAALVLSLAVICSAAFAWKFYEKRKADECRFVEAAKICRLSAEQGDAKAQYKLGFMYSHGQGVPQDYAEAVRWYRKAADQNYAKAEYGLGYSYDCGRGVPQDFAQAIRWYRKAADLGDVQAQVGIGSMYYDGRAVQQDRTEAARWYRKAADQGRAKAQYDLGYMYYYGQGLPQDRAEAERWYHKAADQGDEHAQRALGMRIPAPNMYGKVSLTLAFLGGLLLSYSLISPGWSLSNQQQRITSLIGLFLFFYVGLSLFGIFCIGIFRSVLAVNVFYFAKDIIAGILPVMLFSLVLPKRIWPKTAKIALNIFAILFLVLNLLGIALYIKSHIAPIRYFCMVNGMLIGVSISLTTYLWRNFKQNREHPNNKDAGADIPAEIVSY